MYKSRFISTTSLFLLAWLEMGEGVKLNDPQSLTTSFHIQAEFNYSRSQTQFLFSSHALIIIDIHQIFLKMYYLLLFFF